MTKTDIQIRFTDIDMLGHVNNVVLQQYYDLGKVDYFRNVLNLPALWNEEAFIAAATSTNYFEEVRVDDVVYVTTKIIKLGTKSITLLQEIIDCATQRVKGQSESVLVAFDLRKRESFIIHDHLREKITAHERL